ncbi:pirin family protein [Oceanisphaera pacifica]|uniref:Pirin family protein n=1 Tax=Oceanisphaera pacifica TaxID=2818389 RepID=A0ABS3NGY3_9GAMM|nr:pirin family protein [Oceanisphaera pacifica]MBO1519540.1 pirin family protein [Oceanisphaera pacifica]
MIELRPYRELGGAQHGWLDTRHHFSFADYYHPQHMGWGQLRVWNDDTIAAHSGFPPHPHREMEIITYVRKGAITHQDNLGNRGRTAAGNVQVMSAGTGIAHSEMNIEHETTQIFQIWIMPNEKGLPPRWGTKPFPKDEHSGDFVTLASGFSTDSKALSIRANARLMAATLKAGQSTHYQLDKGRKAYLVPASGQIEINGVLATARDGVAINNEPLLHVSAQQDSEIVLVDVA